MEPEPIALSACAHYLPLPGPSGRCFYLVAPRPQTEVQFKPFCCNPDRPDVSCPAEGLELGRQQVAVAPHHGLNRRRKKKRSKG